MSGLRDIGLERRYLVQITMDSADFLSAIEQAAQAGADAALAKYRDELKASQLAGDDIPPHLDINAAAELLSASPSFVRKMVEKDRLRAYHLDTGGAKPHLRFKREDVLALLVEKKSAPTTD